MKIAIKYKQLSIDSDGRVAGHDAGATLVRRLLHVFPGAELVGEQTHRYADFDVQPLEFIDAANTVLINMDVIDSTQVWLTLHEHCASPKIMNFAWWSQTHFSADVELAELALSVALFPTFANSERTATALRELVKRLTVTHIAQTARISWVNLGIRVEHVLPREEPETPVVLYPAIYMSNRKRPELFLDIVKSVVAHTPIQVEARLAETDLVSEMAMALGRERWAKVGPLVPLRSDYWKALARTTAFVATAKEESYGLEYIEALLAGAVGVFPDLPWARAILPALYPYFYGTPEQAAQMLEELVRDPAKARAALDASVGGEPHEGAFAQWLAGNHSDDKFESSIAEHVTRWFSA
jgi:hypothetical protein